MCVRYLIPAAWMTLLILGSGYPKAQANPGQTTSTALPELASDTVLRVHWIGKRQLAIEGGAFYFNRVLNLPASQQIEARAFDRLAAAPWLLLKGESALATAPAGALRPLLENLAYEETYLEIRTSPDGPFQLALAIQLDEESRGGWQTNLAVAVQSLTGFSPAAGRGNLQGWTVIHPQAPARVEFARAGDWTLLGIATTENVLLDALIERVTTSPNPFGARTNNLWLTVDADLNWVTDTLGVASNPPADLPSLSAVLSGDGGHVLTDCELTFTEPFRGDLEPWVIPEEAIQEPLTSFLAMRGLRSLFTRLPGWSQLPLGEIPDQMCAWSQAGTPFQLYLAAPLPNAGERMNALSTHLLNKVNPWLKEKGPEVNGQPCPLFQALPGAGGVVWGQMQGLQPFTQTLSANGSDFLLMGLIRPAPSQGGPGIRTELSTALSGGTNLVCLGWEDTSSRLNAWGPVLQTTRAVTGNAPLPEQSLSAQWLGILASRVNETRTTVTRAGPNTLNVHRTSTLGFNAAELHLITDWLESPHFPRGLHTFLGESPRQPKP